MSPHRVGAFTVQDLEALLSPVGRAVGIGQVGWSFKKPGCLIGALRVQSDFDSTTTASQLQIYIKQLAPSEFELQYMVRGVPVRRCDVNGTHRPLPPQTTHKHTYQPATGAEGYYVPKDIPAVRFGPTVARGVYRDVFTAFAAECHVNLQDGYWIEPPT